MFVTNSLRHEGKSLLLKVKLQPVTQTVLYNFYFRFITEK